MSERQEGHETTSALLVAFALAILAGVVVVCCGSCSCVGYAAAGGAVVLWEEILALLSTLLSMMDVG